jgi:hypothetical protein
MRRFFTLAVVLVLGLSLAAPVAAAPAFVFDPGVACAFGLGIDFGDGGPQNAHEFKDGRLLSAGRGNALTFTNMDTKATFSTRATGSSSWTVENPDGSTTQTLIGQWLVILFPTDVPPGPSTTIYVGRVVVDIATDGVWTIESVSGTTTDVCAALS